MSNVEAKMNNKKIILIVIITLAIIGIAVFFIVTNLNNANIQQLESDLREQELLSTGMYASLLEDQFLGGNASFYISKWEKLESDVKEVKNNSNDNDYGKKLQDLITRYEELRIETKKYLGK